MHAEVREERRREMKVQIVEYEGRFGLEIEPETVADASILVRLKINGTKEILGIYAEALRGGTMNGYIVIGKRRQVRSEVK
jgi:hypothetical protein